MKVKDVYRKMWCGVKYRVVGYYNDANYGILSNNEDDCNEGIMDFEVEGICIDSLNENCIKIMVTM